MPKNTKIAIIITQKVPELPENMPGRSGTGGSLCSPPISMSIFSPSLLNGRYRFELPI